MNGFKLEEIPSQSGKIAIVTGANSGLGLETAEGLAKVGYKVIMAARNQEKAEEAQAKILKKNPNAMLDILLLDLNSLAAIKKFTENFLNKYDQLDLLVNNAGLMMPPYQKTKDGFESQIGINHLGHFLLTGLLIDTLNRFPGSRVVSLSSIAHKNGKINFEDFHSRKKYNAQGAYSQSKLACLMFAYELQRRLDKKDYKIVSVAAHPGVAMTNLMQYLPPFMVKVGKAIGPLLLQPPKMGAMPTLRAALDPSVKGGEYFGPSGFGEIKGAPERVHSSRRSLDREVANKLWELSEKETGIKFL
ncbi:oxidoreductase [Anditalea andensis]|uniref:Short-chain dehydrogenase n=1 Tax=Anditalea andensis TaxID=1048983 RepID=A0A074L2E5_9BACT|nr:oxidoreductase [Anditalea andensis]KEO74615.1 short-chain dehydrogenase [Anditalea andensis]